MKKNAILTAILVYMASEEPEMVSKQQHIPVNPKNGRTYKIADAKISEWKRRNKLIQN